jgi:hypothetical protein
MLAFAGVVKRGDVHENGRTGGQTIEGSFALFHNLRRENHGWIRSISYRCPILFCTACIVPIDKYPSAAGSAGRNHHNLRHVAGLRIARTAPSAASSPSYTSGL